MSGNNIKGMDEKIIRAYTATEMFGISFLILSKAPQLGNL
jgi:hypothetical protein